MSLSNTKDLDWWLFRARIPLFTGWFVNLFVLCFSCSFLGFVMFTMNKHLEQMRWLKEAAFRDYGF